MNLTLDQFVALFPELSAIDNFAFAASLRRAYGVTRGFPGLCDPDASQLALGLYVAHIYTLGERAKCHLGQAGVKRVASQDDSIEFLSPSKFEGSQDQWLSLTNYGLELLQILNSFSSGVLL